MGRQSADDPASLVFPRRLVSAVLGRKRHKPISSTVLDSGESHSSELSNASR